MKPRSALRPDEGLIGTAGYARDGQGIEDHNWLVAKSFGYPETLGVVRRK